LFSVILSPELHLGSTWVQRKNWTLYFQTI